MGLVGFTFTKTKAQIEALTDAPEGMMYLATDGGLYLGNGTRAEKKADLVAKPHVIDMRSYDENYWHPVTIHLPKNGFSRVAVSVELNTDVPSWSTHARGFTCEFDILTIGNSWGVTNGEAIVLTNSYKFADANPVGWMQLTYPNYGVLFLRGGARYNAFTSFDEEFTPHDKTYTWTSGSYQQSTGGPHTSWPGLDFVKAEIQAHLDWANIQNKPTLGTAASKDTGASTGSVPTVGRDGALAANKPVMTDSYLGLKTVETLAQEYVTGLTTDLADKLSRTTDKTDTIGFSTSSKIPSVLAVLTYAYSKSQVDDLIAAIAKVGIEVVATLPTASAETMGKIYLIPSADAKTQNVKDEYITWLDGSTYKWEKIGSTQIDLSDYYTKSQIDALIAELAEAVNAKPDGVKIGNGTIIYPTTEGGNEIIHLPAYPTVPTISVDDDEGTITVDNKTIGSNDNPVGTAYVARGAEKVENPLKWSGYSSGSYDGSAEKTIVIPTSLPASDVPDWAKQANKPQYNYSEIGGLSAELAGIKGKSYSSWSKTTTSGVAWFPIMRIGVNAVVVTIDTPYQTGLIFTATHGWGTQGKITILGGGGGVNQSYACIQGIRLVVDTDKNHAWIEVALNAAASHVGVHIKVLSARFGASDDSYFVNSLIESTAQASNIVDSFVFENIADAGIYAKKLYGDLDWSYIQNKAIDDSLNQTSTNPIQNKAVTSAIVDIQEELSDVHTDKVNKSGDTITGLITRNGGRRWIDGRDTATVSNGKSGTSPTAETFNPVCSVKTHDGAWAIGSLCRSGSNPLYFVYTKDSDYSTGGTAYYSIELPAEKRGVIALTSDIPSVSVNASQGTISVGSTTVGTSNNPVGNARSASTAASATKAESITYKDARSTNPAPYSSDFFKGIEYVLKSKSADGLQDIGTYHGVMTLHQWGDVSGGDAWQLAFAQNGNISFRHGKTSWSDWGELVSSGNVAKFTASGMRLVPKKIHNSTTGTVDDVLYLYSPTQLTIGTGASEAHVSGLDVRFARRGKWTCRNKDYGSRVRKRGWRIVDTKELCADGQQHYVIGDHNGNGQGTGMSKINVDVRLVGESPASYASGWLYKVYIGGKYKLAEIIRLFERAAGSEQIEFYDGNLKVLYCRDMATEPDINRYHSVVTLDFGIALNGVILPFGIVLSNSAQKWDPSLHRNVTIPADDVREYYRFAKFAT